MDGIFDKNENWNLKHITVKLAPGVTTWLIADSLHLHFYYNRDDFNIYKSPQAM